MEKAELKDWTAAIKVIVKDDGSLERLPFGRYNGSFSVTPVKGCFI
jgi:hypothetical protein